MLFRFAQEKLNKINLITAVCAVIIFFACFLTSPFMDTDFGWHLKTGEFILKYYEIPRADLFSYSMPGFKWVDYEYGFHIIIGVIYKIFGIYGISAFFGILNVFLFIFLIPKLAGKNSLSPLKYILGFLLFFILYPLNAARPAIFTWIFFVLTLVILREARIKKENEKKLWFLPLIFLVWANLHPGFPLGLILVVLFLAVEYAKAKSPHFLKNGIFAKHLEVLNIYAVRKLFLIFLISCAATFINPYFYKLYFSIFNVLSDSFAKAYIMEWHALNVSEIMGVYYIFFGIIFFMILALTGPAKGEITDFTIALFFYAYGFINFRNAPFFIFSAVPELSRRLCGIEIINGLNSALKKKKIAVYFLIALLPFLAVKYYFDPFSAQENRKYPAQAIEYLKNNSYNNIFNFYDWGGYLIWKIPEKKVFIDGRMPEWKTKDTEILKDYAEIVNFKENSQKKIDEYKIDLIFIYPSSPILQAFKFNNSWQEVYRDKKAVILINYNH